MAELEQELLSALQTLDNVSEKPCGCQEETGTLNNDPFAGGQLLGSADLAAELDSALNQVFAEGTSDTEFLESFSVRDELAFLEFAAVDEGLPLNLNDIIAAAERYPGLKITFSF